MSQFDAPKTINLANFKKQEEAKIVEFDKELAEVKALIDDLQLSVRDLELKKQHHKKMVKNLDEMIADGKTEEFDFMLDSYKEAKK